MSSDDDTAYKQLFAHPEMVRDLLLSFVPGDWLQQLDLSSFERVNGSYISDGGDQRHGDIVKHNGFSQPGRLPPMLPIVLYTGKRPWRAKMNLSELVSPAPRNLQALQASQGYLLLDLHRMNSAGLHKNLISIVFEMERARSEEDLSRAVQRLNDVARRNQRFELTHDVGIWAMLRLRRLSKRLIIKFVADAKEVAMPRPELKTFLDGLNYGMLLCSQQDRLLSLLRKKFGKVPKRYENKIDNAEMDDLDIWYSRLFEAGSVKEIFTDS